MKLLFDLLIILVVIIAIGLLIIRTRYKLLKLWKEVSVKDVIFHKLLLETTVLYYECRADLENEETQKFIKRLSKYKRKKLRYLLLKERQNLFLILNKIYNEIEEIDDPKYLTLKHKFEELQKARRLYNSKVLLYNQTISVFPTRFLAIKMNLTIKEYFG